MDLKRHLMTAAVLATAAVGLAASPASADPVPTPVPGPAGPCSYANTSTPRFTVTMTNDNDGVPAESIRYTWYVNDLPFTSGYLTEPLGYSSSVKTSRALSGSAAAKYRVEFTPSYVGRDAKVTFSVLCG